MALSLRFVRSTLECVDAHNATLRNIVDVGNSKSALNFDSEGVHALTLYLSQEERRILMSALAAYATNGPRVTRDQALDSIAGQSPSLPESQNV